MRTDFDDIVDPVNAHKDDHKYLHLRYNSSVFVDYPKQTPSDNVAMLRSAIASATIDRGSILQLGKTIFVAPGDYEIDDTIEIRNTFGLRFVGSGFSTRFIWKGAADKPMFKIAHCRDLEFGNILLSFQTLCQCGIYVLKDFLEGSTIVPTHNRFFHIYMQGQSNVTYGFSLGSENSVDANNDFMYFENCEVANYREVAWFLPTSQSYNHLMVNCRAIGDGINSKHAIKTGNLLCGSFKWQGGAVAQNTVSDFYLGRNYQPYSIDGVNSEVSARFIISTNAYNQIMVSNCRWAANELHEDGQAIVLSANTYNFTMDNCSIGDGAYPTRELYLQFNFANQAAYDRSGVIVRNCRVYSAAEDIWSAYAPHVLECSTHITDEQLLISKRLL